MDDEAKIWREKYAKQLEKILEMEKQEKIQYQKRVRAMEYQKNQTKLAELISNVIFKGVNVERIVDALSEKIQNRILNMTTSNNGNYSSLESLLMEQIYKTINQTMLEKKN